MSAVSTINPQANLLNDILVSENPQIMNMLSHRGKHIFFPNKGILGQSADAKGKEINATIGIALEEDGSPLVLNSISKHIGIPAEMAFPYAPSFGRADLRELWKKRILDQNPGINQGDKISLPVVTCALTHALSIAGYLFLDEGDVVISPDLYWGNYRLIFNHPYGSKINVFETFNQNGGFNIDGFVECIKKTKSNKIVALLNFPNNPTGYTLTEDEADLITQVLKSEAQAGKQVVALLDDAYFGLVFEEGIYKESLFSKLYDLHENILAVKIDGATKEDYVWGFRVGFMTYGMKGLGSKGLNALEQKTAGAVRGNISNASNLSQSLIKLAIADENYSREKEEKFQLLKKRYLKTCQVLDDNPSFTDYFEALPFNSGYFMCVRLKKHSPETVRKHLLEKYSVGVIALEKEIRVAFSSISTEKIPQLFERLFKACQDLD